MPAPHLGGVFAGQHQDVWLVAGGAGFPDGPPWKGGRKHWFDHIYVAVKDDAGARQWRSDSSWRLPAPLANGISVSLSEGLLCAGGMNGDSLSRAAFLIKWDGESPLVVPLPALPEARAFAAGAGTGRRVWLLGGQAQAAADSACHNVWMLDLAALEKGWQIQRSWPGPGLVLATAAIQQDAEGPKLFLMGGRSLQPGGIMNSVATCYQMHPLTGKWDSLPPLPRPVAGGAALATGASHVLHFGGENGANTRHLLALSQRADSLRLAGDSAAWRSALGMRNDFLDHYPGFDRHVYAFHSLTRTWTILAESPFPACVTHHALSTEGGIVLTGGEVQPGMRSDEMQVLRISSAPALKGWNLLVIVLYAIALAYIGWRVARRNRGAEAFFRAGQRIPGWAAGLSLFGTSLSAITFMAVPAKTFAGNWLYLPASLSVLLVAPLTIRYVLPFFRRLNLTSAYEYLEKRYNRWLRWCGAAVFLLFQTGRLSIVLYLPSLALSAATGMNVDACIVLMGVLVIAYTALGGIEAVIWTDVLQVVVLMGGVLVCLAGIVLALPGGAGEIFHTARTAQKFQMLDLSFTLTAPVLWVTLLGGFAANLISQSSDQSMIQYYLSTPDERRAGRAIRLHAVMSCIAALLFFAFGTALYAFYKSYPAALNPALPGQDALIPWYVVSQLPAGFSGLVLAGIFAAAMSSLDAGINAAATVVSTDFFRRLRPGASGAAQLRIARLTMLVFGLMAIAGALLLIRLNIRSAWDAFAQVVGLFAGGLSGLFLLGIFSRRAHASGALAGFILSAASQAWIAATGAVHALLYPFVSLAVCVVAGWCLSLLLPGKASTEGLHWKSLSSREK